MFEATTRRVRRRGRWRPLWATLATATIAACGGGDDAPQSGSASGSTGAGGGEAASDGTPTGDGTATAGGSESDLVARGERVYNVNCIACHARDPRQDGGLGPAIAGSSRELIEARVLRAEYPPGYTPKKDTRLMVPLKHLEPDIDALAAYLGTFE